MNRFVLLLALFVLSSFITAMAYAAPALNPPLTGEMTRLQPFAEPKRVGEVLLARDPDGLSYLSQFKGQVILLNIWAKWCPPCIEELPSLNALQHSLGSDDFKVVTVSLDRDDPVQVRKFMEENKLDQLPAYVDSSGDIQKMDALKDVVAVPVTLILNRQMEAVALYEGDADWNGREARLVLEYYLKNLPPLHMASDY